MITLITQKLLFKSVSFIEELAKLRSPVFTKGDIRKIAGLGDPYLKVSLNRLVKSGRILRVERGKYALTDNPYLVASNLIYPSYVSFLSAFAYRGLTSQIIREIQVVSSRRKRGLEFSGFRIVFIKFSPVRVFGFVREELEGKYLFVAEVEKAVIDSLYLPKYCPISEVLGVVREADVDDRKLVSYAIRMRSNVTLKRLGYILELAGEDIYTQIGSLLNRKYDPLNPLLPRTGKKNKKWRLIVNEVLE